MTNLDISCVSTLLTFVFRPFYSMSILPPLTPLTPFSLLWFLMPMLTPAPTPPHDSVLLFSLSVEFLSDFLVPCMIPKWLRQLRESSPKMDSSRSGSGLHGLPNAYMAAGAGPRVRKNLWRKVCHKIRNTVAFMIHVSESSPTWKVVASTWEPVMCVYEEVAGFL